MIPSFVQDWQQTKQRVRLVEKDTIDASSFNLMGNSLNDPIYHHDHLPTTGTELPPGWHLAYFPPRCPEQDLSKDGYEQDWKPPSPFDHRMWAGGKLRWNQKNRLRVGQDVTMTSQLKRLDWHPGGQRGDTLFTWVDKTIGNKDGWAVVETRCWAFVKDQPDKPLEKKKQKQILNQNILDHPDFTFSWTPSPIMLFRFSALTFNSHLIHYDQQYSKEVERQQDCLVHGPLSLTWMLDSLHRHLKKVDTNKYIESLEYRCYRPLIVRQPLVVAGKQQAENPGDFDLWVLDAQGNVAVHGVASVGFSM
ncbi:uncharacterized protein BX664DRAFT_255242 [Halteromyces radiatus]|uniref:uncharacterized protein n=1 Tax=Halteromyces radiatus TaxID=101107 RepID=UPI00221F0893|nr:uncharacterized protein BX664DRAFT_255242 [Halteromyces radiatus]KAI8098764.1 hypothetical protein BX664DRAFT_255242 [Halteromyces radiatus]